MKAKTLLELVTLSSSIYALSKDEELMSRLKVMTEKGKNKVNSVMSESIMGEDGQELEFVDKIIYKAAQAKEELDEKIEELITKFYQKINVAHLDEIKALNYKLEQSDKALALIEARLNKLESQS